MNSMKIDLMLCEVRLSFLKKMDEIEDTLDKVESLPYRDFLNKKYDLLATFCVTLEDMRDELNTLECPF